MKNLQPQTIAKFFAGEASIAEQKQVKLLEKENPQLFLTYKNAYQADLFAQKRFSKDTAWQHIYSVITAEKKPERKILLRRFIRYAAIFVGIALLASAAYFYSQTLQVTYRNTTAGIQSVVLPDGSEVSLDKNAQLCYTKDIFSRFQRTVSMKGRAFFHVTKDPTHPFKVKAKQLTVTVLGTRFTVNELSDKIQVFLTEGKVMINTPAIKQGIVIHQSGDQVIVANNKILKQDRILSALYASWMDKKVYFNNCTVGDVVGFLSDSYDIRLNIHNPMALQKKLYGSAPSDNPQLIIQALSQVLQTNIQNK